MKIDKKKLDYEIGDKEASQKESDYWEERGLEFVNSKRYLKSLLVRKER